MGLLYPVPMVLWAIGGAWVIRALQLAQETDPLGMHEMLSEGKSTLLYRFIYLN